MTERELKRKGLEGLTEGEVETLKEKINADLKHLSWKGNHLTWMGKDQERLAEKLGKEDLQEIADTHKNYSKDRYPHHILGGDTWREFLNGFLTNNPSIAEDINKFYEEKYNMYLETVDNLESNFPVFVIGNYCPKLTGKVTSLIVDYKNDKKVIVLYINN